MQVTLPEMGESVTEGTVAKWLKQPGDPVREGEALGEVTTDKVDAEVPAPATGTLTKILAEAGKTIAVGAPLAEIAVGADGDGAAKKAATLPTAANGEEKKAPTSPSPASAEAAKASPVEVTEGAELLAKAKGIDLATVKGSGPGGSIRRRDVAEAVERKEQTGPPPPPPPPPGGGERGAPHAPPPPPAPPPRARQRKRRRRSRLQEPSRCGARLPHWSSTWRKASRCRRRRASARYGSTCSTNGVVSSTSVCRKRAVRRKCLTRT